MRLHGFSSPASWMPDEYFDCILRWQETRNSLTGLTRADIGYENGVLGGVSSAVQALTVPGEAVLLHAPAYIGFTHVLDNLGRKAEPEVVRQDLDAYEAQEAYTLEYVAPLMAIQKNRSVGASPYNPMMFEREARVLELLMSEGYF